MKEKLCHEITFIKRLQSKYVNLKGLVLQKSVILTDKVQYALEILLSF